MNVRFKLRRAVLAWMLVAGGTVMVAPPVTSVAVAKRRKRKAKSKAKAVTPAIRKEGKLAPRKDVLLDDDISTTKDLKEDLVEAGGPTLSPEELQKAEFESLLEDKLDEEIELAKQVVELTPSCEERAPIQYRLGDLYWEKAKRSFFKANDFNSTEKSRKRHQKNMSRLQRLTLKNYQFIIDDCPSYSDYPKVLFYLAKAQVEMDNWKDAVQHFKTLIQDFGETEWLGQAWFMVGEFYFNIDNNARKAFKAYKKAAESKRSSIHGFAVYKQGWCHVNMGEWLDAAERFKKVISIVDDPGEPLDKRQRAGLRKESLKDFVRAFSHVGDTAKAAAMFETLGGKRQVPLMMESLGKWYISRDSHGEAIAVFKDLIKRFPGSSRLPVFQGRIVNAASKRGNDRVTVEAVKQLTKYFAKVRAKSKNKKLKKVARERIVKDLKEAEDIAENTLRALAVDYHKEAKKLHGKARDRSYRNAHDLYSHYLDVFKEPKPGADVNYVFYMRYYFAEVLYQLDKFEKAAVNYDMVVDMNPNPETARDKQIILRAAEDGVRAWDELVQDTERIKGPPKVKGSNPMPIPRLYERLINACQRYKKYVGPKGDRSVEIAYKEARTNYIFNHFKKAAPAFNYIVKNHADREEACYSANLVLDIFNGRKNFKALRKYTRSYLKNEKICATAPEDREKFAKIEEQATFFLIKTQLEDKKKYVAAGNAYMDFYRQYGKRKRPDGGKSIFAIDAVYNAAVNYDLGQRLNKANEVRAFMVKTFADEKDPAKRKLVVDTAFNIAQSYERVVDFKSAAETYEGFAKKYKTDSRTKDAIYNAGLYRATLGDYALAKRDRRDFISLYPSDKDAHKVAYAICETLEREAESIEKRRENAVSKWTEAHDCFFSWVKNKTYVKLDTDMLCHAQHRRGEIMRLKTKYAKGALDQKRYLYKMWPSWKKKGVEKLPRCAAAIAELQFRSLRPEYKHYSDLRIAELNPTKPQKFKSSVAAKIKARDELIGKYKTVVEVGVAEWALASLFMIGESYRDSIDKVLHAPIPKKVGGELLTDEIKTMLRDQLKQQVASIDDLAVDAYRLCVDKANELGVYNRWSIKALDQLQELRPQEYPLVDDRLAEVAFKEVVSVQRSGLVLFDGTRFKRVYQTLKDGVGPPAANGGDAEGADGDTESDKKSDKKAKAKAKATPSKKRKTKRKGGK